MSLLMELILRAKRPQTAPANTPRVNVYNCGGWRKDRGLPGVDTILDENWSLDDIDKGVITLPTGSGAGALTKALLHARKHGIHRILPSG